LDYSQDEVDYLKNRYEGKENPPRSTTDWFSLLSTSYTTYTKVKTVFNDLGIDADEVINVENASRVLSNPVVAASVYEKIEREFGIPAEKSAAFAEKNRSNLEGWTKFVEENGNE